MRKSTLWIVLLVLVVLLLVGTGSAAAQPAKSCGLSAALSVTYSRIDADGYAPRPNPGSETTFNCIAARDPDFASRRFPSAWEALNYWFGLYSQELGIQLQPLPAPTQ